jgi:hypothetical protein
VWKNDNKYDFLSDYKFYRYPSYTYGLGSISSLSNSDYITYSYVEIHHEALRNFNSHYYFGFGYNLDDHFDIANHSDFDYFRDYNDTSTHTTSSGIVAHFIYDSRKNINNPKDAFYGSILYRVNFTWLGSSNSWQEVLLEGRKYFKLSSHDVLAFWSLNAFTFSGKPPYLDLPSNGWNDFADAGRGYTQGRFRGPDMLYAEAEYRFGITRNGFLGGVVFTNAETVSDWPQKQFNEIFPAVGTGIRIKFNSRSDVNICIDYAIGIDGSNGLFLKTGEVF